MNEQEFERLKGINADLLKLKDAIKAAAVLKKHSSEPQVFDSLVDAVSDAFTALDPYVKEALYYRSRGEDYDPRENWDSVRRLIENGQLALNRDENGVCPRDDDRIVHKAIKALDELEKWLES